MNDMLSSHLICNFISIFGTDLQYAAQNGCLAAIQPEPRETSCKTKLYVECIDYL
jgi:hypothetical protein